MAIDNINPNELSLQDAAGMQLVHVIRRIIEEINNGGDTPTPTPSEPTGIYYCTFDVTTKDEITAAIADELLPVCFHADKMYYLVAYQYGVYTFATISRDRGIISRIDCRVNGWSVQEPLEIQKLLTFDFSPTENSTNPVTSGGVYTAINNITIDPQDIVDAVDDWLDEHSSSIGGLTFEDKQALMNCFAHVAWIDANGQTYYDALYNALFNTATLESIYALFTQGSAVIYDTDSLDSLRQYLVVTAYYSDETSAVVTDYTLSGTLTVGTSTITASYGGKSSTFNVTVSQSATLSSISAVFNQGTAVIYTTDTLNSLKQYLTVTAIYSDSSTAIVPSTDYTLSGTLTAGTITITVSYGGKTDTFNVTVTQATQNTTAQVATNGYILVHLTSGYSSRTAANGGITVLYDMDAPSTTLFPAGIIPTNSVDDLKNGNNVACLFIYDSNDEPVNFVNELTTSSLNRWAQNRAGTMTEYSNSYTVATYTKIAFSVDVRYLDDAYMYDKATGQIWFAGINTP